MDLIAYEGGQGLVDFKTSKDNEHPNPLLYAANRDPRMAGLYTQFLEGWKAAGGQLFMHYSSPQCSLLEGYNASTTRNVSPSSINFTDFPNFLAS